MHQEWLHAPARAAHTCAGVKRGWVPCCERHWRFADTCCPSPQIAILPMLDETIVIEVTGRALLAALENGVSQYPMREGRFPQVRGQLRGHMCLGCGWVPGQGGRKTGAAPPT